MIPFKAMSEQSRLNLRGFDEGKGSKNLDIRGAVA